jgi:hypothetical protein
LIYRQINDLQPSDLIIKSSFITNVARTGKRPHFRRSRPGWPPGFLLPGRVGNAIQETEHSLEEDSLNLLSRVVLPQCLCAAGRYEHSSTECRRILELDENHPGGYWLLASNLLWRETSSEALPLAEKAYSPTPWSAQFSQRLCGAAETRSGRKKRFSLRGTQTRHTELREVDQTARWFEKSIE